MKIKSHILESYGVLFRKKLTLLGRLTSSIDFDEERLKLRLDTSLFKKDKLKLPRRNITVLGYSKVILLMILK